MSKSDNERQGCLSLLFGGSRSSKTREEQATLDFRLQKEFLSAAELSFYHVLVGLIGKRLAICPQVRLADVFYVPRGTGSQAGWNRINQKHVDFLVCDPKTMLPLLGIELDDASHGRSDRAERDRFVDEVFLKAGLPLLHIQAQRSYNTQELITLLRPHLTKPTSDERKAERGRSGA